MKYRSLALTGILLAFIVEVSLILIYFPRAISRGPIADTSIRQGMRAVSYHDELERAGCPHNPIDQQGVADFVQRFGLQDKRLLEVGALTAEQQDVVENYTALAANDAMAGTTCFHKPLVPRQTASLPFADNQFDAIASTDFLEHVPNPETMLSEMRRVTRDGGLLYVNPSWQTRPWHGEEYASRPYSELDLKGMMNKASIPVRDSVAFRLLYIMPIRMLRLLSYEWNGLPTSFRFNEIIPNFESSWHPDSDALNTMDPYEAMLWFRSRGDTIVNYETPLSQFVMRTGVVIVRVHKTPAAPDRNLITRGGGPENQGD